MDKAKDILCAKWSSRETHPSSYEESIPFPPLPKSGTLGASISFNLTTKALALGSFTRKVERYGARTFVINQPYANMTKVLTTLVIGAFLVPTAAFASPLTYNQANSIVSLLQAFGVDQAVISNVWSFIKPTDAPIKVSTPVQTVEAPSQQPITAPKPVSTVQAQPQAIIVAPVVVTNLVYRDYNQTWEITSDKELDLTTIEFLKATWKSPNEADTHDCTADSGTKGNQICVNWSDATTVSLKAVDGWDDYPAKTKVTGGYAYKVKTTTSISTLGLFNYKVVLTAKDGSRYVSPAYSFGGSGSQVIVSK